MKLFKDRGDVSSGNDACSLILQFIEGFVWRTKQRSIPVIKVGCEKAVSQYGSFIGGG